MNEKYTNTLISSTRDYLNRLLYLGVDESRTLHDLHTLKLIHKIYVWADWMGVDNATIKKIEKILECIIRSNSHIRLPIVIPGTYYTNVNTPQTDYTWRRIIDDPDVVVHETIT